MSEANAVSQRVAQSSGGASGRASYRVLIVLPPDFQAPESHRRHRFPHQGPAIVAASVARDGIECRAADLDLDLYQRPLYSGPSLLDDEERLARHLRGEWSDELVAFAGEMIERLGDTDVDAFAISLDRHTQIRVSVLLGVELKRRFGKPVIVGGGNSGAAAAQLTALESRGVDLITTASSPDEIRVAFAALREVPANRWELAREPVTQAIATSPDEWPTPDFSIYDLERYRRDPFAADGALYFPKYDGSIGPRLFLPYHFAFDCQYACSFCQRGGKQTVKSMDRVVRDLSSLAERHECSDFMLFDAQINLYAEAFSKALLDARLDVHWTDSFRVAPRRPREVLEHMARAGCVGLTFGVDGASDRMLKRMIKGHSSAQATKIVRDAHAAQMFVRVNLLPCFPGETREDHEITVRWVSENAWAIDDIVPSSFYLAEGSPVGQMLERYGLVMRGGRELHGDHKFRKNLGSRAYDEVGGYTWEEREAMLRPSEEELRAAWSEGRRRVGATVTQPSQTFALRREFATKQEAYGHVLAWLRTGQPLRASETATLGRALSGVSAPGQFSPDELGNAVEDDAAVEEIAAEIPIALPSGSLRARALARLETIAQPMALVVTAPSVLPSRFSLRVSDAGGAALTIHVERLRPGARFFKRGARLMLWYSHDAGAAGEPRWSPLVLKFAGDLLCSAALDGIADELTDALESAPLDTKRSIANAPASRVAATAARTKLRTFSVVDLVRRGLKPAASLIVESEAAGLASVADLPARAISRFAFEKDSRENLVYVPDAVAGSGARMLYVGRSQREVDRLAEIEHELYARRGQPGVAGVAIGDLQEEFGVLMGFPPCCAKAFARGLGVAAGHADFYASVEQRGWHLVPINWRYNHVAARQYELPFLIHVPCSATCRITYDLVESTTANLYTVGERRLVEEILSQGAVVWPDDRIAFFRPRGTPNAVGEVPVAGFNVDVHAEMLRRPRPPERTLARDRGIGFLDADVSALRVRDGRLEVFAGNEWYRCAPSTESISGGLAAPLIVTAIPLPVRSAALPVLGSALSAAPARTAAE